MRRLIAVLLVGAACSAPTTSSAPAPVSPTPDVTLGTPIATRSPSPTPTQRPSPTIVKTSQEGLLVLSDVPAGFKLTVDKETTADDVVASANAADKAAVKQQLLDRAYVGGWIREFTKDALFGAVFIRSGATKYSSIDGGKYGIGQNVQLTTQSNGGVQISLGETIGDESYGVQLDSTSGNPSATTYIVYFRIANISNTVGVAGVKGTFDVAVAIDLAKKQLARFKA
ncbi:MAG: hypothetical protein M3P18_07770 [Actinomycetota bacterium]|nr:hypothetical protein [Actinomycetota bacterium]